MKTINRIYFLVSLAFIALIDGIRGRTLAFNAQLTPMETSHGTESLMPDAAIAFNNAVVMKGSDDRHLAVAALQTDIPLGVLLNDQVSAGDVGVTKKNVAIFGVWPESLPCTSTGAIAVNGEVVIDPATPGKVKALPATSGQTYIVIGRSRFTLSGAGEVSLIHCCPRKWTNP